MIRKFTLAATALCASAAMLLSGCSDKTADTATSTTEAVAPSSKPPLDANGLPGTDIVKQAVIATRQLSAAHVQVAVDPAIEGLPMKTVSANVQKDGEMKPGSSVPVPVSAKGKASIRINGSYAGIEFVVVGGALYAKIPPATTYSPMGRSGDKDIYDPAVILDNSRGLLKVLDSISSLKVIDRETLAGGVDTVKVTGTIDAKTLDPILPNITEVIEKGHGDASKVPVTLWVTDRKGDDSSKPLIAKMEVTMKDKPITIELSDFDKKIEITKP